MLPYQRLIQLNKDSSLPIYLQVVNEFTKLIQSGKLVPGLKLPGSRSLSNMLGLHRNTIVKAFDELEALGWIEIKPNKGAFVSEHLPIEKPDHWEFTPKQGSTQSAKSFEFYDFPHLQNPVALEDPLAFDDGLPDIRLAPITELARAYGRNLHRLSYKKGLSYRDGLGSLRLRKLLAKLLNETRGLNIKEENILITRGTIMAIHLAVASTVKQGDYVVVGETNYKTADMVIRHFGGQILRAPVDEKGISVDVIEQICKKNPIRLIYVTSHHHHPTTVTLSPERRIQLLRLAEEYGFIILEDDYDYDFHFDNNPVLPLASGDQNGHVFYFGSFTKVIAPSVRVGYLVGPSHIIQQLPKLRRILDRQGDIVLEESVADLIEDGTMRRHLRKSWKQYKARRDLSCKLLKEELGEWLDFSVPAGGMAIWVKFDERIHLPKLSQLAATRGLSLLDGKTYNPAGVQLNACRMGFASMDLQEIEKAVGILKDCIKSEIKAP